MNQPKGNRMRRYVLLFVCSIAMAMSGCGGGGGGGTPVVNRPDPVSPSATRPLPLPLVYGLPEGPFVIAAGRAEEHGNLVVSCPAGGDACVLNVNAADGIAYYDITGGMPSIAVRRSLGNGYFNNVAGVDPRDTWKPTLPIESYFDLDRTLGAAIKPSVLRHASSDLRAHLDTMSILGSKDGITYAQGMSGPTDTIDIDFTGHFPNMPDFVQGILERAGKSWSYRLKDVLGPHQLTDEVVTRLGRDEQGYSIPYYNDGILVDADTDYQNPAWDYVWGYSRGGERDIQADGKDFMVRSGWLELAATSIRCCGYIWAGYLAAHEVGHAIGQSASESPPDNIARHVDYERGLWTGPAVTEANGGVQVSFQRSSSPDDEFDFGHLGACPMINSYCGEATMIPHELDFAYLKDIGYTVLDEYPTVPEVYSYGAWAEYSGWTVLAARHLSFSPSTIIDNLQISTEAFGTPPADYFTNAHTGTLTWNGSLLATDLVKFAPVFGDASITLSADTLDGSVQFMDLHTVQKSRLGQAALTDWRIPSLGYDVRIEQNAFTDSGGRVIGNLYGPNHEEAAGTLHDTAENIAGAFGGTR